MNKFLEIFLFAILFGFNIILFLSFSGMITIIEQMISDSELKMNDKINELRLLIKK